MITVYCAKHCEKIANAVANGANKTKTDVKLANITTDPLTFENTIALCLAKNPLGHEAKQLTKHLSGKTTYVIGAGFSFEDMRKLAEELKQCGAIVETTLCLKRNGILPIGADVGEVELVRAAAFGERISANITGTRQRPQNEKNRIRNYQQPFK